MPINLPTGLAGLLAKMAGAKPGAAEGKAKGKAAKKGLESKEAGKSQKGEALGEELLVGMGYAARDKTKAAKNKAEKANIARFLQDPESEAKQLGRAQHKDGAENAKETKEADKGAGEMREADSAREAQKDSRAEDKKEDVRAAAQEPKEPKELKEKAEAREAQPEQRHRDDLDEEGKGAGAWVLEDNEDEPTRDDKKRRTAHTIDEETRCHGTLDNGTRCLRKPMDNSPFCGEHKAAVRALGVDQR